MSSCCPSNKAESVPSGSQNEDHCQPKKIDYIFWIPLAIVTFSYIAHYFLPASYHHEHQGKLVQFISANYEFVNTMALGLAIGIFFVGLLSKIPKNYVTSILGNKGGLGGILRATAAGVLLDLCSHGILLIGTKLYKRGASIGQVMAFLIASPWNSFSLTLILFSLIGAKLTFIYIACSMVVAILTGLIFDFLVDKKKLPHNPYRADIDPHFKFWPEFKKDFRNAKLGPKLLLNIAVDGIKESRVLVRWLLIGIIIACLLRTFISMQAFQGFFGPTIAGMGITLLAATIIEVCSEGTTPIAADIVIRANAPGNGLLFLMAGVSTDYTEVLLLKEVTQSWKIALFLPLITIPQILFLSYLLN